MEVGTTRDLAFTDTGLAVGTAYTYSLRRVNHQDVPESTDLASVVVTTTTSAAGHSDTDGIPDNVEAELGTNSFTASVADDSNLLKPSIHRPN